MTEITLANDLLRALATPAGAHQALSTLGNLMTNEVKQHVLRDAAAMRQTLMSAKRMVLGADFLDLCIDYASRASVRDIAALMRFGVPPFASMWIEWLDRPWDTSREEEEDRPLSRLGVLIEHVEDDTEGFSGSVRMVHAFDVPSRNRAVQVLPLSLRTRFTGPAFNASEARGLLMSDGSLRNMDAGLPREDMRQAARALFLETWSEIAEQQDKQNFDELADRCVVLPFATPGRFLYAGAGEKVLSANGKLFVGQLQRAFRLLTGLPLSMGIALGMLSLAPVRHVVDARPWARRPDQPAANWRWKLDHDRVTLTRPVRTAEVVRHVTGAPSDRGPVALHPVMGHWRVRGGRPSCNHRWRMRLDDDGTQVGSQQSICSECSAIRSWVRDHSRGSAERGVVSREYEVHT